MKTRAAILTRMRPFAGVLLGLCKNVGTRIAVDRVPTRVGVLPVVLLTDGLLHRHPTTQSAGCAQRHSHAPWLDRVGLPGWRW